MAAANRQPRRPQRSDANTARWWGTRTTMTEAATVARCHDAWRTQPATHIEHRFAKHCVKLGTRRRLDLALVVNKAHPSLAEQPHSPCPRARPHVAHRVNDSATTRPHARHNAPLSKSLRVHSLSAVLTSMSAASASSVPSRSTYSAMGVVRGTPSCTTPHATCHAARRGRRSRTTIAATPQSPRASVRIAAATPLAEVFGNTLTRQREPSGRWIGTLVPSTPTTPPPPPAPPAHVSVTACATTHTQPSALLLCRWAAQPPDSPCDSFSRYGALPVQIPTGCCSFAAITFCSLV